MGSGIARVGDTASGVCTAHSNPRSWTGTFTSGSGGFTVNGAQAVAVGDTGLTDCGHHFQVTTGSPILTGVNGKIIARSGDAVTVLEGGYGTIGSGSPNVISE